MREAEKSRQSNMTPDGYRASATRARQQDQPSPYSPNAVPSYGGQPMPQAPVQQQYDQYGRVIPQQPQYGQPGYPQQDPNYPYGQQTGQTVGYVLSQNPQQGRPMATQAYPPAPAGGYQQGRGMDTYGGIPDNRSQYDAGAYGSMGRSQPMAQQPQYSTSGQTIDPYAYQRGA